MIDYTTFPEEAYNDSCEFVKHATNIGRAYRNRALELIDIRQSLSQIAPPVFVHEDAELRSVLRVCDVALRSAAESGERKTDEANERFKEATQVLSSYSERLNSSHVNVSTRMKRAKRKDLKKGRSLAVRLARAPPAQTLLVQKRENNWMSINFVVLPFPALAALHDPETIIVRQVFTARPSLSEIFWNFSRYQERARITLEQNPHFYSSLPDDESANWPLFECQPLGNFSISLELHDTIYVLVDRPTRVFLETEQEKRSFGNVWMLNGSLIFKDSAGVLEGEQLIGVRGNLRCFERPAVPLDFDSRLRLNRSYLRPIITPSADITLGSPFEKTILSRPVSCSNNIYIYDTQWASVSGSAEDLDPFSFPLPPTSEKPGYRVLYTSIETLNDDVLLSIFNYYRLDNEENWNVRLGWCKLSHICRRWRDLIYESVFYLNTHILCTNGTPVVDMLAHFPLLPLVIDYQHGTTDALDWLGISHTLRLRDRVRRVILDIPSSSLDSLLVLMDEPFPILEHLSILSTAGGTSLMLPETFLAPNLLHLSLSGIRLPGEVTLLSTVSLVTLTLTNIQTSGYFLPKHLVAHLQSFSQLEELSIGFSIPLPRPSAEWELSDALETPVTIPALRRLTFRGVGAYLESLVSQMRAPLLEQLDISLFNQVAFALPRLSDFTNATQGLKPLNATVISKQDTVSLVADHHTRQLGDRPLSFSLHVISKHFDWQIDSAAQICRSLMPVLSGVEQLTLDFDGERVPAEWQDGAVDSTTWRELLGPFIGARELYICRALTWELSSALELGDVGLDPGLLPSLQELDADIEEEQAANAFASFIDICQVAGRPVRLQARAQNLGALPSYQRPKHKALLVGIDYVGKLPAMDANVFTDATSCSDRRFERDTHPLRTHHQFSQISPPSPPPPKRIRCRVRPSHRGAGLYGGN